MLRLDQNSESDGLKIKTVSQKMLNIHIVEENWLLWLYLLARHHERLHHSSTDTLKILIIATLK